MALWPDSLPSFTLFYAVVLRRRRLGQPRFLSFFWLARALLRRSFFARIDDGITAPLSIDGNRYRPAESLSDVAAASAGIRPRFRAGPSVAQSAFGDISFFDDDEKKLGDS